MQLCPNQFLRRVWAKIASQEWDFIVVRNPEAKRKIRDLLAPRFKAMGVGVSTTGRVTSRMIAAPRIWRRSRTVARATHTKFGRQIAEVGTTHQCH
jgi:nitroreductase